MLRVLLVEDSPILGDLVTRLLDADDAIEVIGRVDDAAGAVDAIRASSPDVVVLDLHLRQGSGYDVLRRSRAQGSEATFVVLTNHTSETHRAAAQRAGAAHFFDKSREIPALLALVREMAARRR